MKYFKIKFRFKKYNWFMVVRNPYTRIISEFTVNMEELK